VLLLLLFVRVLLLCFRGMSTMDSNFVKMNIGHPVSKSKFRTLVKVNLGRRTSR
jgi:hypothetical protein